ncbi:MAG: hypothetical protein E6J90_24740 [Deltaproteobacteria bacterium]|nr:MAG: hypothetical protein E6J91_51580 [Deltaproteobacteria bacterium]TMQ15856.1 MAG: hypothetical protein E6J90_24740 [Deltaproteobacteria bacterium]
MRHRSSQQPLHPLEHHPSFRAIVEAASPLAELATRIADREIVGSLAVACSDLADGFAAPPDSPRRLESHHRAWVGIREIDRVVAAARHGRRAPGELIRRAQRAIDRADVLVGALLPS